SGLYHFHFRQYDPSAGVWTSEDPIGIIGGNNLYSYVHNNPINKVDYFGLYHGDEPDTPSAGELGVGNPGSYGGENTQESMYGDNGYGTGNDPDNEYGTNYGAVGVGAFSIRTFLGLTLKFIGTLRIGIGGWMVKIGLAEIKEGSIWGLHTTAAGGITIGFGVFENWAGDQLLDDNRGSDSCKN
ncbi:RHS repeat-associated core domain-containing protein, partial [Desulforhopalus singaporensis]